MHNVWGDSDLNRAVEQAETRKADEAFGTGNSQIFYHMAIQTIRTSASLVTSDFPLIVEAL